MNIDDYIDSPVNTYAKSIKNGKDAENVVKNIILEEINLNFHIESYTEWMSFTDDSLANVLVTDVPFIHPITKNNGETEFGIGRKNGSTREMIARLEVKHQDATGSVTEKLEAISNRVKRGDYPENGLILVVSGDIYTEKYKTALQKYCDVDLKNYPHKKIWVIYPHELTAKFIITEVEAHYDKYHS